MTHADLVNIAYKWTLKRCCVAFREFVTANYEIPDVIGFRTDESLLVEVKASRADFLRDKKKPHRARGMGRYRFFLCPAGLIQVSELPENWGLVLVNEAGKPEIVHNPYCSALNGNIWSGGFETDFQAENRLMYSALRRLKHRIEEVYPK